MHLEKSSEAYDECLKFMENATDVECWIQASYLNQLLGRLERAAQTLGTIIRNFPKYHDLARINLYTSERAFFSLEGPKINPIRF